MYNTQQSQQEPEVTLTVKASWVNVIIAGLDEVPHKYSRPIIDAVSNQAQEQLKRQQGPSGPLQGKVIQ